MAGRAIHLIHADASYGETRILLYAACSGGIRSAELTADVFAVTCRACARHVPQFRRDVARALAAAFLWLDELAGGAAPRAAYAEAAWSAERAAEQIVTSVVAFLARGAELGAAAAPARTLPLAA